MQVKESLDVTLANCAEIFLHGYRYSTDELVENERNQIIKLFSHLDTVMKCGARQDDVNITHIGLVQAYQNLERSLAKHDSDYKARAELRKRFNEFKDNVYNDAIGMLLELESDEDQQELNDIIKGFHEISDALVLQSKFDKDEMYLKQIDLKDRLIKLMAFANI